MEQEEQSQVRFSREDEHQRSWPIHSLVRLPAAAAALGLHSPDGGAAHLQLQSLSLSAPAGAATVRDSHPFYPLSSFSVRGVDQRDIEAPRHLLLSSNYYRKEWAAMGQRRLKNIAIVMEWCPQTEGGAAAAAASDPASPSRSSAFSSAAILSHAQEAALRTAFSLFATEGDSGSGSASAPASASASAPAVSSSATLSVSQLQSMMREVGEDLSADDLASLLPAAGGAQSERLSFDDFRRFLHARSSNRTGEQGGRYFVAVSLKEAESLRRLLHTQPALLAAAANPAQQVSIGLRLLGGPLLDASPAFRPASAGPQSLALQSLRFVNNEFFFNDLQLSLLLTALQGNPPQRRQAFFENLLRCRRRDRRRFNDTPLLAVFQLADEQALLSYRAKVARVRSSLRGLGLSPLDAFTKFDALGDGMLNTTELAFALIEFIGLPLKMEDVQQSVTVHTRERRARTIGWPLIAERPPA